MNKFLLPSICLLASSFFNIASAQVASLSGKVTDSLQKPLDGAAIALLNAKTNVVIKSSLSTTDGSFTLEQVKYGSYIVWVTMTGFNDYRSAALQLGATGNTVTLPLILLSPQTTALTGVTVTAQKNFVERKIDRTVVNVDALISNAGTTALDVLEKSPGVAIDQNGSISLKGKNGVVIFIDDKPTYLSGSDLENYLRSLPSSTIDQIELMTNPPAKYDAAGSAGVINIRTKRSRVRGFNGSLNVSYSQGKYARTNNSLNFNYRNNKFNLSGNFGFNTANNFNDLDIDRRFKKADGSTSSFFLQNTFIRSTGPAFIGKLSADYYLSDKSTIGVVLTGLSRDRKVTNNNTSRLLNAAAIPDSTIIAKNLENGFFHNGGINVNYRHQYAKNGPELTADIDYIGYQTGNDQVFNNSTFLPDQTLLSADRLNGQLPAHINIYSAKTDYSHPFSNGIKLAGGLKISYTETDNIAQYEATINNITKPDYDKSNHFIYKETISAAYMNMNREYKRFSMQLGLRMESTVSDGHQLGNIMKPDSAFKRTYTGLFPTAYVNYKIDSAGNHLIGLNYGRRINRPYYQDLNPFVSPLDKFTYYVGNPFLKPAYANNIELSYTFKNKTTLTFSYGHTKDDTNETIEIVNGTYYSRPGNIGATIVKSVSLNSGYDVAKWFSFNLYTELTNIHTKSDFYTGPLNTQGTFWYVQPNFQFKLGKDWNAQLDGVYQSDVTSAQFLLRKRGRLNAGLSKKLSSAATIRLSVNDIFYTQINNGVINNLALTDADFHNRNDTRSAILTFTYRFGSAIANQRSYNASGADSEKNRVKN